MKKILKTLPYIAIALLVGVTAVYAAPGSKLVPPGPVANTMYSLTDIYNLAFGTTTSEGTGEIETTPILFQTGKTLTEVYTALFDEIAKLSPSVVASGTTAFGIEGDINVVDTSSGNATTSDVALGKIAWVDGVEITGTAPAAPATLTWQTDPELSLCWSHGQLEVNMGCTVGSGFIQTPDTITTLGAVEYCQYLNTDGITLSNIIQNIWHLPTIQEYTSITDYTRFPYNPATLVSGFNQDSFYWANTVHLTIDGYADNAWYWFAADGRTGGSHKYTTTYAVRCAK